jgi:hypothetical protein
LICAEGDEDRQKITATPALCFVTNVTMETVMSPQQYFQLLLLPQRACPSSLFARYNR